MLDTYSAVNSLLSNKDVTQSRVAFTPILPHPITDFESVYTVMINFQDVLKQKNLTSGPLWCDEGVYRLAKEIQLIFPQKFDNLFIGLDGFDTEKVILACCGQLLRHRDVFVQNEIYGPNVTDGTILKGTNYVLCREAMRNLTEAVNRVKIEKFMPGRDEQMQTLNDLVQNLIDNSLNDAVDDENIFRENWAATKKNIGDHLFEEYCYFKKAGEVESEM